MRIASKPAIAASLLSVVVLAAVGVLIARTLMEPASAHQPSSDIIELHSDLTQVATADCVQCHGDKSQEESLDPSIDTPHAIHIPMLEDCSYCHKSADLLEGSAASLMKQVSADICAGCHGPGGSAPQLFGVEVAQLTTATPEATATPVETATPVTTATPVETASPTATAPPPTGTPVTPPPTGGGGTFGAGIPWTAAYIAAAGVVLFAAGAFVISYRATRRPS